MRLFRNVTIILAAALATGVGGSAHAGVLSGQDLMEICEPARADPVYRLKLSECTGYILGVSDTFDCENKTLGYSWDSTKYKDQQKLVGAVVEWLHFHPNYLHYQASGLVASALAQKYPCPSAVADQ